MNTKALFLRRAVYADFTSIWKIFKAVLEPGDTYVFDASTSREDAFDYWFGEGVTSYVAEEAGQILGMYKLVANHRDRGSHVANASFMVDPDCHDRGVGKAMGLHCLQEAKRLGYLAIQFNFVVSTNHAAISLWQKLGFSIVGTLPKAFNHRTLGYVDAYVMYRFLDAECEP